MGLEIDQLNGIIYGTTQEVGDFNVSIQAWNSSGLDEKNMTLYAFPGEQSIISTEIGLLRYGDPPVDLHWTSTSGLPVQIEILEAQDVLVIDNYYAANIGLVFSQERLDYSFVDLEDNPFLEIELPEQNTSVSTATLTSFEIGN